MADRVGRRIIRVEVELCCGVKGGVLDQSSISGELMSAFDRAAWVAANRLSDRRFHIIMGCIFGGAFILPIALAWIVMANEPAHRAAYMAKCQETGFSQGQCAFLYAERRHQDADTAALTAIAIGAGVAVGQAASGR